MRAGDVTAAHRASLGAIMTFFTVPSMGVHPDRAIGRLDSAESVMAFLHAYRPQPFPGQIDRAAAVRGSAVYARDCAACHGSYEGKDSPRLVSFPNWIGQVGTDPLRARAFDKALAAAVGRSAYRDRIAAAATGAYAAPPLTGLWASAPYLHNGSVPTIAALLDPPRRPASFLAGGHRLDFKALGIALAPDGRYPAGYRPWSRPALSDARAVGRSNRGHEYGSTLSPEERQALIEYLKLL
jgi:mono/diheme cytochrome c family protein